MLDDNGSGSGTQTPTATDPNPGDGGSGREIDALTQEVQRLTGSLAEARDQAARYRTERNKLIREHHAQAVVLGAHNIDFDPASESLDHLKINNGGVSGEQFTYRLPVAGPYEPQKIFNAPTSLTMEDVKAMSSAQINDNWDEVTKVLNQRSQ